MSADGSVLTADCEEGIVCTLGSTVKFCKTLLPFLLKPLDESLLRATWLWIFKEELLALCLLIHGHRRESGPKSKALLLPKPTTAWLTSV